MVTHGSLPKERLGACPHPNLPEVLHTPGVVGHPGPSTVFSNWAYTRPLGPPTLPWVDPHPKEVRMSRFAQHTKLVATQGNSDRLARKFLESVEIQRENPACELMIVCRSPVDDDVVFLTEVWSSESEWEKARSSPVITEWAQDMPTLVAGPPDSVRLDPVGGKGLV